MSEINSRKPNAPELLWLHAREYERLAEEKTLAGDNEGAMAALATAAGHYDAAASWLDRHDPAPVASDATATPRFRIYHEHDLDDLPDVEWLVDGMLPVGGFGVLFGEPGSFKSFVALDMAFCIATGHPYHGHAVKQGRGVFIAAEGFHGVKLRQAAWKKSRSFTGDVGVDFIRERVNLLDAREVRALAKDILATGPPPQLIVPDTWHANRPGADENDAGDTGTAIDNCRLLAHLTGAAVLTVHHPVKNGDTERGSGALRGGADFMALVSHEGMVVTIGGGEGRDKVKDAPMFMPIRRVMEQVTLGVDAKGNPISSLAVGITDRVIPTSEDLTPNELSALESVSRDFLDDGARFSEWKLASGVPKGSFARVRTSLVRRGYVEQQKRGRVEFYRLTALGQAVLSIKYRAGITEVSPESDTEGKAGITLSFPTSRERVIPSPDTEPELQETT